MHFLSKLHITIRQFKDSREHRNLVTYTKTLHMSPPFRHVLVASLIGSLLTACGTLPSFSGDSFTFEGQLPANFALRAQAHYGVANSCDGRSQTRSFERDFEDTPHAYQFRIPVSYRDGLCEMQLVRVGLYIDGRYGDKDWELTYDNGSLVMIDTLPKGAPGFDANGTLTRLTASGVSADLGAGAGPLDLDMSRNGKYLYVLKNGTGTVGGFEVAGDGSLTSIGDTPGLAIRAGYMGLAAY